jgi:hypothetical protein
VFISQKKPFFIVIAVNMSNRTYCDFLADSHVMTARSTTVKLLHVQREGDAEIKKPALSLCSAFNAFLR